MTDLISREDAIAYHADKMTAAKAEANYFKAEEDDDSAAECLHEAILHSEAVNFIRALPAAPSGASKARALLAEWLETPNEGDPMIDMLLGVIREAHAALEGGAA